MAVTFLQAVNSQLRRNRVIQGDAGALVTSTVTSTATGLVATGAFTDSARQAEIDISIQLWNEVFVEMYGMGMLSPEVASATFTLVTAQREYTFPSNFARIAGNSIIRGATHQWVIAPYLGGFDQMLADQPGLASQWQGEPSYYAFSPVSIATIRFDTEPTITENGKTYNALYEKRINFTATQDTSTDTLPFADTVSDSLIPVVAEAFSKVFKKDFDPGMFRNAITRAVAHLTQQQSRTSWGPRVSRG